MRDIDAKITEWRRQMAAGGIKSPSVLDELEAHLREDMERQVRAGWDEGRAFEAGVERIGKSELLKAEFAKITDDRESRFGKVLGTACCVFAALYSMALSPAFFFVHELSVPQRILGISAVALTLLALFTLRFNYKLLPSIRNWRARNAIVGACGLACVGWLLIFANLLPNVIVPLAMRECASGESIRGSVLNGLQNAASGELRGVFVSGVSLLWAMTLAAVLGGIAYGLEEAARRQFRKNAYV